MEERALPEPFSAEHLRELRQRWERDPKSRAFLQLAEEYRRAGRLDDAVHVLQAGLEEHPTYLSAQVALGRCLMESGQPDAAAEILERAVARDPTQLVANKLLVEAYLAKGQAAKASERLNLYKLFNDRDAEIAPLEARIRALQGLPAVATAVKKGGAPPPPTADASATFDHALFDLPAVEALPEVALEPAPSSRRSPSGAPMREPFGRVYAPGVANRIDSAFAQQGIFPLAPATVPAPLPPFAPIVPLAAPPVAEPIAAVLDIAPATNVEWESQSWPDAALPADEGIAAALPDPAAAQEVELPPVDFAWEPISPAPAGAFAESDVAPALPVSAVPKAASATLGELYLAQGHLDEAEESFQSVLQSRPGDTAALAGLESVRQQRGDEAAAFAEDVPAVEEPHVIVGGLTARKAALLKDYLERIRRGARRHVS